MAATLKGCAVVWGSGFTATVGVIVGSTTGEVQSADFTRDATATELRDHIGDVIGMAYTNKKRTWNVSVIPSDASAVATAQANMDAMIPALGTVVTVVDGTSAKTDNADLSGYLWMLDACSVRYTNTGPAVVDMTLSCYEDNDLV